MKHDTERWPSFGFVFSYGSRRIILKEGHVARSVYYILSGEGLYSFYRATQRNSKQNVNFSPDSLSHNLVCFIA